jgi:hypothetical protein
MQVTLSGVFATKEEAEKARAKHEKALAAFCKQQSKETRTIKIEGRVRRSTYANS